MNSEKKPFTAKCYAKLEWDLTEGLFYFQNQLRPPRTIFERIISTEHKVGHWGRDKTIDLLKRNFSIPGLDKMVLNYITSCDTCQRNKSSRHKRYGLLNPLKLPNRPWESISMDFIVSLPKTRKGNKYIWVVVDRFIKMAHFILLPNTKVPELAKQFLKENWCLHGVPEHIISD